MKRRTFMAGALASGTAIVASPVPVGAQSFPTRPITIIVPFAAGGGVDAYARALAAVAAQGHVSVPLVVANQAGSGGLNGAQSLLSARPDGHTVMLTSGGTFLLSTLTLNTEIDAIESFAFAGQIGNLMTSLMVPASSPFETVEDLIAAARAAPGRLRWAHSGRGGFHHVGGLGFLAMNGIEAQDVPFQGGGPTRASLLGRQVDFGFLGIQQLAGFENQLRALAVNSDTRDAVMTEVPSFAELGIPFARVSSPVVMMAPKATPPAVLAAIEDMLRRICAESAFAELLAAGGAGPDFVDAASAEAALRAMHADVLPLLDQIGN